jgi:hypothetical protein
MFIDADHVFNVNDVIKLFNRPEPVACGAYFQKKFGTMNIDPGPDIAEMKFGNIAPPEGYNVRRTGAGFLRIKGSFLRRMIAELALPGCGNHGALTWPFFHPIVQPVNRDDPSGPWEYLCEDMAFCERCRWMGVPVVADTSIRVIHIGPWPFSWEEGAGAKIQRVPGITVEIKRDHPVAKPDALPVDSINGSEETPKENLAGAEK